MKRAFAMLASASLILGVGCGNYDYRLGKTLEEMRYRKKLDDNLIPAPTKGRLEQIAIFVRPPLNLQLQTKTFAMTVLEAGRFDVENSFIDQDKQISLHLLARIKQPKSPTTKKGAAPAAQVARGDFRSEVIEIVKGVYGVDVELAQFKDESKKHGNRSNTFKTTPKPFGTDAKKIQVYFYGDKTGPYEVALIFEYPPTEQAELNPKITLCLESFAVGQAATKAFAGGNEVEAGEEGDGGGGGAPPPI